VGNLPVRRQTGRKSGAPYLAWGETGQTSLCREGRKEPRKKKKTHQSVHLGVQNSLETNDHGCYVVGCLDELHALEITGGDDTRTVSQICTPGDFLAFSVTNGRVGLWGSLMIRNREQYLWNRKFVDRSIGFELRHVFPHGGCAAVFELRN
jgi:hypothetical protein